jgi:hypothetical protein
MTASAAHRARPSQLKLPLHQPDPGHDDRAADAWKLDEQTRRIGREGVAAARALLEQSAAARTRPGGDRGPTDRAA